MCVIALLKRNDYKIVREGLCNIAMEEGDPLLAVSSAADRDGIVLSKTGLVLQLARNEPSLLRVL